MSDLTPEEQALAALADPQAVALLEQPNADAAAAAEPVKPAAKKPVAAKKAATKEAASDFPQFMQSTTQFPYVDPDTGIRFAPGTPIKVEVEPKVGSWLHSQIAAGYIGKA